uniref:Ribosomal RNA-processing protein 8 n=2 Tax=Amorphochlora amoebiformis TaxID=1561963 RepID=A0A7S0DI31_9EUKA|mmetsp:Transcript_29174/g.46546  ORF Transcript_29174/g.46546 Transcript_29174/m.46546 type:complete len:127 (+) Transcript_29174:26-406(+)
MLVIDPFRRSRQHNQAMQKKVESVGGADVVTSMSVLNVLPTDSDCLDHIRVCWKAAKPNGLVFFKVWAGSWPMRGTGQGQIHKSKNIWQNNRWASEFKWMITKVFGKNALIFIENNLNLIVVKKAL